MLDMITNFLASDIRTATPIILAGMGAVFCERSGVVNIGIEGLMLIGSFIGVMTSYLSGSAFAGACAAAVAGLLIALLFGYITISLGVNQIIAGTAINILANGFTVTMNRAVFGVGSSVTSVASFKSVAVPGLSSLPVLGSSFFQQTWVGYLTFLLVPLSWFFLQRTKSGLKVRAVGEHPHACATVGIHVKRIRYLCVMYCGLLSGLAGSFVSMGLLSAFTEDMVAGRGFIVVAAVVCGNYTPVGIMLSSLLFGAASALQFRLLASSSPVPYQFWNMLPYLITVIAICAYRITSNQPASSGKPYFKNQNEG